MALRFISPSLKEKHLFKYSNTDTQLYGHVELFLVHSISSLHCTNILDFYMVIYSQNLMTRLLGFSENDFVTTFCPLS